MEVQPRTVNHDLTKESSPVTRFDQLHEKFTDIIKAKATAAGEASIYIPESRAGIPTWLLLSTLPEVGSDELPDRDEEYLRASWGKTQGAADMTEVCLSRAALNNPDLHQRYLEALELLEMSVDYFAQQEPDGLK